MLALELLAAVVVVGTLHFMAWNQGYLRGHEDGWNSAHRTPGLDRRAKKPAKGGAICPKCHDPLSFHKEFGCTMADAGGGNCGCQER